MSAKYLTSMYYLTNKFINRVSFPLVGNPSVTPSFPLCICLVLLFSVAAGCGREQPKREVTPRVDSGAPRGGQTTTSETGVVSTTTLLATIGDQEKPHSVDPASNNKPIFQVVFNERGSGVAYISRTGGQLQVVHNGKVGRPVENVEQIVLSPDGQRIAYGALVKNKWRIITDDREGPIFDMAGDVVFSPDSRHIAYQARTGETWYIVVDDKKSAGSRTHQSTPLFSGDSAKIAYVQHSEGDRKARLIVSDLAFDKPLTMKSSGDLVVTNGDRTRLAATMVSKNRQRVVEFSFARPEEVTEGPMYDSISNLVFGPDGVSLSYVAEKQGKNFLVLNGREERLPEGEMTGPPVVCPDKKGVAVIMASQDGFFLHQAFSHEGAKEKLYGEAADLVYSTDGSLHAYAARKGKNWFIVVNGKEGPAFDRVTAPLFSPDSSKLVYRVRKDGKRFVVVADTNGAVIREHPVYEQVFQPVFTADGQSVAYGVKDGQQLIWRVEKL